MVGEKEVGGDPEHHGGEPLDEEKPLPPREPADPAQLQQRGGDRSADYAGERGGGEKQGEDPGPVPRRNPVREVEDHAGEEARLRDAEEEPHPVEGDGGPDEQHRARERPPRRHDARDPAAGSEALQDQVARDFERHVTGEEHPGSQPVNGVAEPEIGLHLQCREGDVEAVQVVHDVAEKQIGNEPAGDPGRDGDQKSLRLS